ncbi:uncharacterized protein K02A2.6-like [Ornithodoros turicata]|uniref:uncharacterized protein K02A2.6-like n=1 Tax=Ornithodoros turicata TaxID=34597 RepID=UPI0031391449
MLDRIHEGHQGVVRCRARAKDSVWWPGVSAAIKQGVTNCQQTALNNSQPREPMIPSVTPELPWNKVGADLFYLNGSNYLLLVDYYSRYPEVLRLLSTSAKAVIQRMKEIFARYGIPQEVYSDSGPQFKCDEFFQFSRDYGFRHTTSSSKYPQSNGESEIMVKTVKSLLNKASDPYLSLLSYLTTPGPSGLSPAQLLMGRRIRSRVPMASSLLRPGKVNLRKWARKDRRQKAQQKKNCDERHLVRSLPPLAAGQQVWIPEMKTKGRVVGKTAEPRSYTVETPRGTLRRNRRQLIAIPPTPSENQTWKSPTIPSPSPVPAEFKTAITGTGDSVEHGEVTQPTESGQPSQTQQGNTDITPTSNVKVSRYGRRIKPPRRFPEI